MRTQHVLTAAAMIAMLASGVTKATESVIYLDDDRVNLNQTTTYVGTWTESNFLPTTYGQGYHFSRAAGSLTMRSTIDIDESGGGADNVSGSQFQAFARWAPGSNRCNAVRIEVRNATTNTLVRSQIVNQTTYGLGFNWTPIGSRFTATPNHLYEIRVISPGVCVTTIDGGMFAQQTYDSSDTFNLTASSIIDEAGIDFDQSPTSTSVAGISTCTSRTTLATVTMSIPDSTSSSYTVCRAMGKTSHGQTGKWVYYSIDDALGNGADEFAYTGVATSTSTYNNFDPFAMQQVYTIGSEGGTFRYYLKSCRQDTLTTGTSYPGDFTCTNYSTRR